MVALWQAIYRDFTAFASRLAPQRPPAPGLYTYRLTPPGGTRRVHLRVEPGGGVLFVDVTDVVHLNATATEMAKWALDGVPLEKAATRLAGRFGKARSADRHKDLSAVYEMVHRLGGRSVGCPTCALSDVQRRPLFSTPVRAPYKADLALTYDCNNDCPHCYNEADRLRLGLMAADQWKRCIDKLCEVGVPHLIFTGGEPTLYPQLAELIRHADQQGPVCGMNTNGRRLADRRFLSELEEAGLNHVQITIGSHRAEMHDRMMNSRCFDQTVRGIENAVASRVHTITNTTLMRMNAGQIEQTIEFLYALGIRTFAVNGMIYSGGGSATGQAIPEHEMAGHLVAIRDVARELGMKLLWYTPTQYCRLSPVELEVGAKRCNAAEYSLCVEPNGDVLPCQSYYSSAGNLLRDPWDEIWNSELFEKLRDRDCDPESGELPEMCWECPDLPLCGGGCQIRPEVKIGGQAGAGERSAADCSACDSGGFVAVGDLARPTRRRSTGTFAASDRAPRTSHTTAAQGTRTTNPRTAIPQALFR